MELTAGSSNRVLAPEGAHLARCIRIIDLGTQVGEYEGKETKNRKIKFSFELLGQTFFINEGEDDEREVVFTVHKEYTASIGPKASLGKDITSWLGKKLDETFIVESLLGKECQVNVVTQTSKQGKEYTKITGIMGIPAKMKVPKAENELIFFSLNEDEFDQEVYDEFSDWMKEVICKSPEAQKLGLEFEASDKDEKPKAKAKAKGKASAPAPTKGKGKKVPF